MQVCFFFCFYSYCIYLMLNLVFVSSRLYFSLCKLLLCFRDNQGARKYGRRSSRAVHERLLSGLWSPGCAQRPVYI